MKLNALFQAVLVCSLSLASSYAAPSPTKRTTCADIYVYFVRGGAETSSLLGMIGTSLSSALTTELSGSGKDLIIQGIEYTTLISDLEWWSFAANNVVNRVRATSVACEDAKVFLGGYSTGAWITHIAASRLTSAEQDRVSGVVTFGDPLVNTPLPGTLEDRRLTFCAAGDLICQGSQVITAPHLLYAANTPAAAAWIVARS